MHSYVRWCLMYHITQKWLVLESLRSLDFFFQAAGLTPWAMADEAEFFVLGKDQFLDGDDDWGILMANMTMGTPFGRYVNEDGEHVSTEHGQFCWSIQNPFCTACVIRRVFLGALEVAILAAQDSDYSSNSQRDIIWYLIISYLFSFPCGPLL